MSNQTLGSPLEVRIDMDATQRTTYLASEEIISQRFLASYESPEKLSAAF